MKGTEKIIAHIQADAKAQADAILAQAEQQCASIRAEYEQKAKDSYTARVRSGVSECQDRMDSIDRIAVSIENSGTGIAADELPMIFEKFYKTDKSRSQDKNGMGLGLYLVKTIVRLHGGDIQVHSAVNQSTRFSFFIPKPQETAKLKPNYSVSVEDAVISDRPVKERRSHGREDNKLNRKDGQNHE